MKERERKSSWTSSTGKYASATINDHLKFKRWQIIVGILAAIVILCSTYAMILPALTMNQTAYCGQEEHVHTDKCYELRLVCTEEETSGHIHSDECYTETKTCVCGQEEETDGHAHNDECYQTEKGLTCTEYEEAVAHEHTDSCYEKVLICGKEEHTHSLVCYSNPNADVESQAVWERSVSKVTLTEDWSEDIVAVAESQLGYKESANNYILDANGSIKGYTRYGAWYGDAYGDWCAMFASFCMKYAEIPSEDMPYEASCVRWIEKLSELDMYEEADSYVPQKGDLIFFSSKENGTESDHVGIVSEIITDKEGSPIKLHTIEGNSGNSVAERTYELNDSHIMGYGILPEGPEVSRARKAQSRSVLAENDLSALTLGELSALLEQISPGELQEYLESLSDDEYDNLMDNLSDDANEMLTMFLAGAGLTSNAVPLADPPIYYEISTENGQQVLHLSSTPFAGGGVYTSGPLAIQNTFTTIQKSTFSKIVLDNQITAPQDCERFLSPYKNVTEIVNLDYLNTSQTTNMRDMFNGFEKLRNIDVSGLDVGNVTDMSGLFGNCTALESIDGLDNMDVKKVTTMSKMFYDCNNLSTIDLSGFKTDSLTNTSEMFTDCRRLSQIYFGDDFDTSKVTDMSAMFSSCITITAIDVSNFDTGAVENMAHMFNGCRDLETLDVSSFDTSAVTDMRGMFGSLPGVTNFGCESLKNLDFSGWNTAAVTDMSFMFSDCNSLTELNLASFSTENVTNMRQMFYNCEKLATIDLSSFNTSNVTNMNRMFGTWGKETVLRELDLSSFDTSNVTDMEMMFYKRTSLQRLDISSFVIAEGTNVNGFLVGDDNLAELKTPASVGDALTIPLPKIMVKEDDHTQIFGRMPKSPDVTGSITLIPYETCLLTEGSESTLLFKKYLDGELVNDPQRFEFGVFAEDGTDTGIRVGNNLIGNIAVETEELPLGRYYVKEITGTDQIIYDNVRYYFTIEEETISTEVVYPSTEVVYLPIEEDYLDTSKYDLVANGFTVTAYEKGTQNPVKTLRAFCADKAKGLTHGSVGTTPNSVYLNPSEDEINIARGYAYTGPNEGELAEAIKCVLFFGDRYEMQEEIWGLLNYGVEVDTSRVGEIPESFKWAIIQQPRANVQPLIVPLWTTEDRDVYDNVDGDSMTRRVVKLETTDIEFNNSTLPENALQVQIPAKKTIDGGDTPIGSNRFKFRLTGNGQDVTVENYSSGEIVFPTMVLTEPGTYTYTIEELTDDRDGVFFDFDKNKKTITVTVSSNDVQTYDPNATYYAFDEYDYDSYYYVDTTPGGRGIVMYCTNRDLTGPAYANSVAPVNQTYRAIINPTVAEIEAQSLVHSNLYGDELNNRLKQLFYYFETAEGQQISNNDKQSLVWTATDGENRTIDSISVNGEASSRNTNDVLTNIYATVNLPPSYNLAFFVPTGTQANSHPQPLMTGYGAVVESAANEVVFDNTTSVGNRLTIRKTVTGIAGDRNRLFNFSISILNRDYSELTGTFIVSPGAIDGVEAPDITSITFNNGQADVQLKHGQYITITGLPDGYVYTVTEDEWNMDGYTSSLTQDPNSNYDPQEDGYYNNDDTGAVDVEFKNHKDTYRAEIKAKKTLDGGLPGNRQFTFILKDAAGNEVARKTNDANGEVTFPLTFAKAGEYTYTIEEFDDGNGAVVYDTSVKNVTVIVGDGKEKLQAIIDGSTFYGSRVADQFYITVGGATELSAYNLYLRNNVYDDGAYNKKIINPTLNDIQWDIESNNYGDALADNLRKLLYYFDTHSSEDTVGQSYLTRQFKQELIWCLAGMDNYQTQPYTGALNTIIAQSTPPDDYTVVLFKSNSVRTRPLLVGCLPTSVTFQGEDDTFENISRQYELPETGGNGTKEYAIGGGLLMSGAILLMYKTKLGRKKEGER